MSFHVPTNNDKKEMYERDKAMKDLYNSGKEKAVEEIRKEMENKLYTTKNTARILFSTFLVSAITNVQQCSHIKDLRTLTLQSSPSQIHLNYVNEDTLPDLVYKTGEIYLQTNEGNFISIESAMNLEKVGIDSIYKVKTDSIKNSYIKIIEMK